MCRFLVLLITALLVTSAYAADLPVPHKKKPPAGPAGTAYLTDKVPVLRK
jgi:hypothetical protein